MIVEPCVYTEPEEALPGTVSSNPEENGQEERLLLVFNNIIWRYKFFTNVFFPTMVERTHIFPNAFFQETKSAWL